MQFSVARRRGPRGLRVLFCVRENIRCIDDLAAHDCQQRGRGANLFDRDGHEIPVENREVGELAGL